MINVPSRILAAFLLITGMAENIHAQNMHGYIHGNYAGVTGIYRNPARLINGKVRTDIQLIGIQSHVYNDAVYYPKNGFTYTNVFTDFDNLPDIPLAGYEEQEMPKELAYSNNELDKNFFTQQRILGPSVMFTRGNQAFALSTAFRSIASGTRIPWEVVEYALTGFKYNHQDDKPQVSDKQFGGGTLNYYEITASYARNLGNLTFGISGKLLPALGGVSVLVDNYAFTNYREQNRLFIDELNAVAHASGPLRYNQEDDKIEFTEQKIHGWGFGFDLGISYSDAGSGSRSDCASFRDYSYRIGVSLMDIGYMRFSKDPRQAIYEDRAEDWYGIQDVDLSNLYDLSQRIEDNLPPQTITEPFSMLLPTTFAADLDYSVSNRIYVNSALTVPLRFQMGRPRYAASFTVTPRYESDNLEFALPLSLYEFKKPQLGFAMRLAWLVVGSDRLGPLVGLTDFNGYDAYFLLKIPFLRSKCGSSGGSNRRFGGCDDYPLSGRRFR